MLTHSANKFVEKYNESAEVLSKTTETLNASAAKGITITSSFRKSPSNLSALNALYELHLQGSNDQMQVTTKVNETMGKLMENLNRYYR